MLLTAYTKELFRSKCMPGAQSFHCFAHLSDDVAPVLPYLNAEFGGSTYIKEPPSVTFKVHGKLITIHSTKIAVNALKDEAEADKILIWMKNVINETWEKRNEIEPSFESDAKPILLEVLKLLPKTNCRKCNEPTCMVFAARTVEGVKNHDDCPCLACDEKEKLKTYLSRFQFDYTDCQKYVP